jgi:hypothetical protein
MGDVDRVLASCRQTSLQSLMHDRLVVEACENVHLHWRNVRIEMSISDAARVVDVTWRFSKLMPMLEGRVVSIPMAAIDPYDNHHKRIDDHDFENEPPEATAEHKAGIEWIAEQMKAGRRPRPIAVRAAWADRVRRPQDMRPGNIWQRIDGFKRYMAHRALGLPTIECFIFADDQPGCQHGQTAFLDDAEELPRGFPHDFFVSTNRTRLSLIDAEEQRRQVNEVELLRNGTIHVHMGDVRLEFERAEFETFAELIEKARAAL